MTFQPRDWTFGVEIELVARARKPASVGLSEVLAAVRECGLEAHDLFEDEDYSKWIVTTDGSIVAGEDNDTMDRDPAFNYAGVELVSPILRPTEASFREIARAVMAVQKQCHMITNLSTGLHVHVGNGDARGIGARVARNFSLFVTAFEPLIHTLLAEYRTADQEFNLCRPPSHTRGLARIRNPFERLRQLNGATGLLETVEQMNPGLNRYAAYNMTNLHSKAEKRTIEFRQSQGSVDPEYIRAWASLCIGILDFCSEASEAQLVHLILSRSGRANFGILSLLRMIGKQDMIEYFSARLHVVDRNQVRG